MSGIDTSGMAALPALRVVVLERTGVDLVNYRPSSVTRRVTGRMSEVGVTTLADYLARVRADPAEVAVLLKRILVQVTDFFRDAPDWVDLTDRVLPELFDRLPAHGRLRLWSAGCASGAEAYSLAMSVAEAQRSEPARGSVPVVVYGTDLDTAAITVARAGAYAEAEVHGVPADLRERYFTRVGGTWVVGEALRRLVVFGSHDLTRDAPLLDLDLIVCRNTLMYMSPLARERILIGFAGALRGDGLLVLGRSESLSDHPEWTPDRHDPRHYRPVPVVVQPEDDPRRSTDPLATFYSELSAARRRQAESDRALAGTSAELRLLQGDRLPG